MNEVTEPTTIADWGKSTITMPLGTFAAIIQNAIRGRSECAIRWGDWLDEEMARRGFSIDGVHVAPPSQLEPWYRPAPLMPPGNPQPSAPFTIPENDAEDVLILESVPAEHLGETASPVRLNLTPAPWTFEDAREAVRQAERDEMLRMTFPNETGTER